MSDKNLHIHYYSLFREARGRSEEVLHTASTSPRDVYEELQLSTVFPLDTSRLKVAVNDEFADWDDPLKDGDTVVFIAPVAGG